MRKLTPYRSLRGAAKALDNGGRFFNVFTHAGDEVVTKAELAKVAGVGGGLTGALLFFEMATCALSTPDREQLTGMLDPALRKQMRTKHPEWIRPAQLEGQGVAGRSYIIEGYAKKVDSERAVTGFITIPIMAGQITTMMMIPITEVFDVCRLTKEPGATRGGCVLVVKKGTDVSESDWVRWGGIAKERQKSKEKGAKKQLYLEPKCYTVMD